MSARLTPVQRDALELLDQAAAAGIDPHGQGYENRLALYEGQPWINWRTIEALERHGLVRVQRDLDGWDVWLVEVDTNWKSNVDKVQYHS